MLYQLAVLTREVADLRKLVEQQQPGNGYTGSVQDIAVAQGPLQTAAEVQSLDEQCRDAGTCQFLVCTCCFLVDDKCV